MTAEIFGTMKLFVRSGKTVAIDGMGVWESYMFYTEGEDSSN